MLANLLENAGFSVSEDVKKMTPYEKFEEVQLPFGNLMQMHEDKNQHTEIYKDSLKGINFLRENKKPFVLADYPVLTKNPVYDWLLENQDKCFVLDKGTVHERPASGNLCLSDDIFEREYESDCVYGTADVVFKIVYNSQYQMFTFNTDTYAFNKSNPEQDMLKKKYDMDLRSRRGDKDDIDRFEWFKENVFPVSEFIPIEVIQSNVIRISHKAYRDPVFGRYDEVTEPYLGKVIKNNKKIMSGLTDWFANGGYIKDNSFYLVISDRNSADPKNTYYLRPWDKEVEKKKKTYITGF